MLKERKLSRRQQRLAEKGASREKNVIKHNHFEIAGIQPLTDNQAKTFQSYSEGNHLLLLGCAGTGKTFLSLALALQELENRRTKATKVVIIRSAQPTKQIGFLPGNKEEKTAEYEKPYRDICAELYNRQDAYDTLKAKGVIEFHSTSFLRGTTIANAIVIFDECQNTTFNELYTVLTRVGDHSRVVICGDLKQDDLTSKRYNEETGLVDMLKVFQHMEENFDYIEFGVDDIVRSGFVRSLIMARYKLGL